MKKIFVCTSNLCKQEEFLKVAKEYDHSIKLFFPNRSNSLNIVENGSSYEENALIKVKAYKCAINDPSMIFVGDDSGLCIPALNNEPGLYSKRWAGYEMTDREILEYCLEKMKNLKGDDRQAFFKVVIVKLDSNDNYKFYHGETWGRILEKQGIKLPHDNFPFRSTFWIDALQKPWYIAAAMTNEERKGFLMGRESAFINLIKDIL